MWASLFLTRFSQDGQLKLTLIQTSLTYDVRVTHTKVIASEYSELWKSLTSSRPGWPFGYHYCLFLAPYPLIFSLLLLHNKRLYVGEARRTMYCSPLTAEIVSWFSLGGFGTNQNPSSGCLGWKTRRYCLFQDLKKFYCLPKS